MNKYAAEKIAQQYYNMGVQMALQGSLPRTKVANLGKTIAKGLGVGSGVALSPAALHEIGALAGRAGMGGATGAAESAIIRNLLAGEGGAALSGMKGLGGAVSQDAASIAAGAQGLGNSLLAGARGLGDDVAALYNQGLISAGLREADPWWHKFF